jgi:hypothetical protein
MLERKLSRSLMDHFSAVEDPREGWRVLYPLREILLLVLCATLAGMEDFVDIKMWGDQRLAAHSSDRGHLFHAIVGAFSRALWAAVP